MENKLFPVSDVPATLPWHLALSGLLGASFNLIFTPIFAGIEAEQEGNGVGVVLILPD